MLLGTVPFRGSIIRYLRKGSAQQDAGTPEWDALKAGAGMYRRFQPGLGRHAKGMLKKPIPRELRWN